MVGKDQLRADIEPAEVDVKIFDINSVEYFSFSVSVLTVTVKIVSLFS